LMARMNRAGYLAGYLKRPALAALTLTAAACGAFGPDREPPKMPSPAHYAVEAQPAQLPLADGVAQQLETGTRPFPKWWTMYQSDALDALVDEGLAKSPSLAAAQSTLKAAREGLRSQIGQNMLPSVDVGFSPTRQRALGLPMLSQQTFLYNVFAAEVKTSYTFDFFGAAVLADRALARQVQQQDYQLESGRRALAANIVVATMAAASLPLRAQALAVRHAQAVLLGRTPDQAPEPLPLHSLRLPGTVPLSIASDLLHQRPDILAAEAGVRAAADAAGAATAAMFPSLTLSASYGRGGFDWSTFTSPAGAIWSVGASLTQPLFHGGALVARKHQYEAAHDAAVAQYRQTVLAAFQNVADTLVSLDEDANTLVQTQRAATAAHSVQRDTESRYRLGATPFFATLTAGQQYQSANA